mmetsp:Transcript_44441/g.107258  ORF Transcript_44441/g.107258 Transcript_44441/m.107258 type:complete len:304 (-) Transcript_44441:629-1540(-)
MAAALCCIPSSMSLPGLILSLAYARIVSASDCASYSPIRLTPCLSMDESMLEDGRHPILPYSPIMVAKSLGELCATASFPPLSSCAMGTCCLGRSARSWRRPMNSWARPGFGALTTSGLFHVPPLLRLAVMASSASALPPFLPSATTRSASYTPFSFWGKSSRTLALTIPTSNTSPSHSSLTGQVRLPSGLTRTIQVKRAFSSTTQAASLSLAGARLPSPRPTRARIPRFSVPSLRLAPKRQGFSASGPFKWLAGLGDGGEAQLGASPSPLPTSACPGTPGSILSTPLLLATAAAVPGLAART